MRGLLVVLLAFCLLLADNVILQGTARLQSAATPENGALEKNGSALPITLAPHLRDNRIHMVTSAPISLRTNQTTTSTSVPPAEKVTSRPVFVPENTEAQLTTVPSTTPERTTTILNEYTTETQKTTAESELKTQTWSRPQPSTTTTTTTTEQTTKRGPERPEFFKQPTTIETSTTRKPSTEAKVPSPQKAPNQHSIDIRSGPDNSRLQKCPRPEDIHPCECVEVATPAETQSEARAEYEVETVAFCRNIRNVDVLRESFRGMQGHHMTYLVLDSVHLPPFPNDLFRNVGVGWMEVLNSTMQFRQEFFQCYEKGCS